ncbi:hypothetical protein J7T55_008035 [Diaporthe amygdali]|uniref:uncharacterized protein n=1 Tax=Phomopsis amygdali TaxID=1214568 RepID=UPI0022FE8E9A|nr:uncharacterized protein J7T55_008035 [Diaporthe amygdali]KAJ0114200.1 hypothetical protein J7T55_008035 [Diaporthe amygdali]
MTGTLTPVRPLGPLPLRLRVSTCIRESQETARRGNVWFVDGPSVHQPTVTCITDAIVQHANPSRFHEGVVLPLGTVEVVHSAQLCQLCQPTRRPRSGRLYEWRTNSCKSLPHEANQGFSRHRLSLSMSGISCLRQPNGASPPLSGLGILAKVARFLVPTCAERSEMGKKTAGRQQWTLSVRFQLIAHQIHSRLLTDT